MSLDISLPQAGPQASLLLDGGGFPQPPTVVSCSLQSGNYLGGNAKEAMETPDSQMTLPRGLRLHDSQELQIKHVQNQPSTPSLPHTALKLPHQWASGTPGPGTQARALLSPWPFSYPQQVKDTFTT